MQHIVKRSTALTASLVAAIATTTVLIASCQQKPPVGSAPLATFAPPPPDMPAKYAASDARCNIEFVQGLPAENSPGAAHQRAQWLVLRGWIVSTPEKAAPEAAWVRVSNGDQSWVAPITFNEVRPDVAKALGSDQASNSGFQNVFAFPEIPAGKYRLGLLVSESRGLVECAGSRELRLI